MPRTARFCLRIGVCKDGEAGERDRCGEVMQFKHRGQSARDQAVDQSSDNTFPCREFCRPAPHEGQFPSPEPLLRELQQLLNSFVSFRLVARTGVGIAEVTEPVHGRCLPKLKCQPSED